MNHVCPDCRKSGGDHFASCPAVQNDPRNFEHFDYWAVLWVGRDGSRNLKYHIAGGGFDQARAVLTEFRDLIQARLDGAKSCPYYEPDQQKGISE